MTEAVLDVESVAVLTGVSAQTLYWNVRAKNLRAARRNPIGLRLSDVHRWLTVRKPHGRRKQIVPGLVQAALIQETA